MPLSAVLAFACGADTVVTPGAGGPALAFGDGGQREREQQNNEVHGKYP